MLLDNIRTNSRRGPLVSDSPSLTTATEKAFRAQFAAPPESAVTLSSFRARPDVDAQFRAGQAGLRAYGLEARQSNVVKFSGRGNDVPPPPAKPAAPDGPVVSVNGAAYEVRPYEKPEIHHDNGFLQNPEDPGDPNPIPTREPTQDEIDYYNEQVFLATVADALKDIPGSDRVNDRLALDDALPAYLHFLTGNGEDRTFDYASYLHDDPAGQATRDVALSDIRTASDRLYGNLEPQVDPEPGDSITFEVQGNPAPAAYPDTEDWQKTIGGHARWSQATMTVTRQEDGSLHATAEVTMHAEDRYDFNPGQQDIATGVPDSVRGVLEETELAHQFTQTGEARFTTSWTIGDPGAPALTDERHGER